MKKLFFILIFFIPVLACTQVPEDAVRYSFFQQTGTARTMAIGGAMGSLGGDITATYVNPAGLGMYKTCEFVFTPAFSFNNNKSDFRTTFQKSNKNNFSIGTTGYVFGFPKFSNSNNSQAISLVFTQTANFNNSVYYKGYNNYSSGSEQWADEIANSGDSINGILNDQQYAYGSAPALYTYLVDTFSINGNLLVEGLPEFIIEDGKSALLQENTVTTKGGIYELALGFANNHLDKLLFGGSIGIPILSYKSITTFKETDTSANTNNNFGYFTYTDQFKTTGAGVNLKLGVIYKPTEFIRLGFALHTPTYMFTMKDTRSSQMETQTENYKGLISVNSNLFNGGQQGESKYTMITPWKFLISGSYVFREIEDVKKQKGFITADIEFVNHRSSRFYSANADPTPEEMAYYKSLGKVIRNEYKGNFNFRLGGELKFNRVMGRLGFAYYSNPYKDSQLKANRMLLSGGIGYRHHGIFVDLTYIHSINKDVNFPYRLQYKDNTFATIKNQRENIVASIGFKF